MEKICIATINFNSEKETHDCLVSLQRLDTDGLDVSIVVIDNGSKSPFVLNDSEKKSGIILIRSEKNVGFTGGSNMGIEYSLSHGCDYVMLINNDTIVDKNLLKELLKPFHDTKETGLVAPKIYFLKGHEYHLDQYKKEELGKVIWYAGGYVDWANVFTRHRGVDEVDHGQYDKEEKITFATGCCMLIKREVLEKIGKFDDKYFLYFEDGDLSQRILNDGYTIVYNPRAFLWHITAASGEGSGSALHDYYLTRNRMIFGISYAPLRSKIALMKESVTLLFRGRQWQKKGIQDFYTNHFGKGSYDK
ncbi:MAG TPA: glycosyltransferase family 2 protein [Candidatus Saccharimonadales bacterium]|nr:glycosyltransferase family 2 protein [Candidatus Saccharimonadales bacterium]